MGQVPFDLEAARRAYRQRQEAKRRELADLHARAVEEAERAMALIVERYRPRRVVQWGSLLRPERFTRVSDIDIAVEGIEDMSAWSRMEAEVEALVTFPLDLVPLDRIRAQHREDILRAGRVVYERP